MFEKSKAITDATNDQTHLEKLRKAQPDPPQCSNLWELRSPTKAQYSTVRRLFSISQQTPGSSSPGQTISVRMAPMLGQSTVTLRSIPHNSTVKIPLPGAAPQRQLLGSSTPKQSGQRVRTRSSFLPRPLSLQSIQKGYPKASKRTCCLLLFARHCAQLIFELYLLGTVKGIIPPCFAFHI